MSDPTPAVPDPRAGFESRLDRMREEAARQGTIQGAGVRAAGGPMPPHAGAGVCTPETLRMPGYYGLPVIKPPVWKWMIPLYFFVGGAAGMSGVLAGAGALWGAWPVVRAAFAVAAIGAVLSTILLVWDLGRPARFLNMLRVFKWQSPMSLGSWILTVFGGCAIPGWPLLEWTFRAQAPAWAGVLTWFMLGGAALAGALLACYTGALIGVSTVPAWHLHRVTLPFHFGMAGLGSACGIVELLGVRHPALHALGIVAAAAETLVSLLTETRRHGAADQALRRGRSGWLIRGGEALSGPIALLLRFVAPVQLAALSFALGSLISRFGWTSAGRASAMDPESVFASQAQGAPAR